MLISALIPGRDWPGRDVGSLALVRDYHATYTRAPFFLPDREKEPFSAVWKEPFRLPNAIIKAGSTLVTYPHSSDRIRNP